MGPTLGYAVKSKFFKIYFYYFFNKYKDIVDELHLSSNFTSRLQNTQQNINFKSIFYTIKN